MERAPVTGAIDGATVSGRSTEWSYQSVDDPHRAWQPGLRIWETSRLLGSSGAVLSSQTTRREWVLAGQDEPATGGYRLHSEVLNPGTSGTCSSDCIEKIYQYDQLGNRNMETVRGGYGLGFDSTGMSTRWTYRAGRQVRTSRSSSTIRGAPTGWRR